MARCEPISKVTAGRTKASRTSSSLGGVLVRAAASTASSMVSRGFVQGSEIVLEYGGDQAVFGPEVVIHRRQVDVGRFGNVAQGSPVEPLLGEEEFCYLEDLLPGGGFPGASGHRR